MAATLRYWGVFSFGRYALLATAEDPVPFVGPPAPPPPLILKKYAGDVFSLESCVAGHPLNLMIIVDRGRVPAFRGATQFAEWPLNQETLHFRAGCVLEESASTGDGKATAEVVIWRLFITHGVN